jgi:hypothetical protein
MPKGSFTPESLTDKWNAYGEGDYDVVRVGLFARLPYQSFQLTDPSRDRGRYFWRYRQYQLDNTVAYAKRDQDSGLRTDR